MARSRPASQAASPQAFSLRKTSSTYLAKSFAGRFCEPAFRNSWKASLRAREKSLEASKALLSNSSRASFKSIKAGTKAFEASGSCEEAMTSAPRRLIACTQDFRTAPKAFTCARRR